MEKSELYSQQTYIPFENVEYIQYDKNNIKCYHCNRPIQANCKAHYVKECPYSCGSNVPIGNSNILILFLFIYLVIKKIKINAIN